MGLLSLHVFLSNKGGPSLTEESQKRGILKSKKKKKKQKESTVTCNIVQKERVCGFTIVYSYKMQNLQNIVCNSCWNTRYKFVLKQFNHKSRCSLLKQQQ